MLFGLGLGLMIAIGVYVRAPSTARPTAAPERTASTDRAKPAARPAPRVAAATPEGDKPAENRFEFYEILPQYEVVVPDEKAPATGSTKPRPAPAPGSYLLQAGSFSAAADADRLKANLALLGFESHVQRVTIDDNVFNRVRIGPIADYEQAKRTQRRLGDAGYDTMLMQVPK